MTSSAEQLSFVVIQPQLVGSLEDWRTVYRTDHHRHATRAAAIAHGIAALDHDDFLLAVLHGTQLMAIAWQYEDRDEREELLEVAEQLGWHVGPPE